MIQISLGALADVLGTSEEQLAQALKEGEEFKPEGEISSYLKKTIDDKIYEVKKEVRDQQYSRGKKEALTIKERELRDKYGLSGSTFEEMIQELQDAAKVKPDMTPDDVRNTEIYKMDVQKLKTQITDAETKAQEAESKFNREMVNFKARQIGSGLLKKHKFVIPEGIEDSSAWEDLLYQRLNNGKAKLSLSDGAIVVLDENGSELQDDRLNPIDFETHFTNVAKKLFKVAASDDRSSPQTPATTTTGTPPAASKLPKPADQAQFLQQVASLKGDQQKSYIASYGSEFGVS